MRLTKIKTVLAVSLFTCLSATSSYALAANLTESEALTLASEAYVYGYPLMSMETTRKVMTNVASPDGLHAPMGQFVNAKTFPDASFNEVTTPNADTLYSVAWLDLSREPTILHVPEVHDRYYVMPIMSAWTNVITSIGTRTTGTRAHDFAIVGPAWKGMLPKGVTEIRSPTNLVWVIGRTYTTGTPEDYAAVHAIQAQYKLTPLSFYGKPYTPSLGKVNAYIDMKTPVRDQVNQMDSTTYFTRLVELMKSNPPAREDAAMLEKMAKIGMVPGQEFDVSKLDSAVFKGLVQAVKGGQNQILNQEKHAGEMKNGWAMLLKTGDYGTQYLQRALVAYLGLGANLPEDAVYLKTSIDASALPLNGEHAYIVHFDKGQLPPVNAFWSLTMYDADYFFVKNALNRYNRSSRDALKFNADGSLDIYVQTNSPGKEKAANWLPASDDDFVLMLRLYWPKESVLRNQWNPPTIQKK